MYFQEDPVSFSRGSCVIFKRILCHLQENPVSSPRGSCVISKRILCHLQECPVSFSRGSVSPPRGSCVIFKCPVSFSRGSMCHLQEDPVSFSRVSRGKAGNHEQPFSPLPFLVLTFFITAERKKLTYPVLMSPIRAKI